MLGHYLKLSFRNIRRSLGYSLVNILGLSVGVCSFLILLLYLNYELSYDRWHPDLKRVAKVSLLENEDVLNSTQAPLAALLREKASVVESATNFSRDENFETPLSTPEKRIVQKGTIAADSLFFKVFPYEIVAGERNGPLNRPNTVVISENIAKKLFGNESPIGKSIKFFNALDCEVTAVMKGATGPGHMNVEIVFRNPNERNNYHWGNYSYLTYIKTKPAVKRGDVEPTIAKIFYEERLKTKHNNKSYAEFSVSGPQEGLFLDFVQDIHNFPRYGSSNIKTVSILIVLAAMLLIAGTINFSNLSIAAALPRAKEIGVKKVLGSSQKRLFWHFMGEVAIQCGIAFTIAALLLYLALPYFNQQFNVNLSLLKNGITYTIAVQLFLSFIVVVILSGLYPAIFLTRFNTTKVLKGDYSRGKNGVVFRNALIVLQFVVATFFIYSVVVVTKQLDYMQTRDKGFSGEQILRIQAYKMSTREEGFNALQSRLMQIKGVESVSKSTKIPGDKFNDTTTVAFKAEGKVYRMSSVKVSKDFFKTLNINLDQGRLFDDSYTDQHTRSAIINQTAANKLGYKNGKQNSIAFPDCDSIPLQVVGVVEDFNVLGMEQEIQPTVFTIGNEACMFQSGGAILVKINNGDISGTVKSIRTEWKDIEPDFDMKYSFLDDDFQQFFDTHIRLQRIVSFFGITAIVISLIGLFALTAFLIGQRRKEISVRRVLGADLVDLGLLLGKNYIRLIILAVVIAVPLSWWVAEKWLDGFAYRIDLSGWLFGLSAVGILVTVAGTVGIHIIRVSRVNISGDLRDE